MGFTGRMVAADDNQDGAFKGPGTGRALGTRLAEKPIGMKKSFANTGAGKLSKSGATTKSESLARLRGKGALA